MTTDTMTKFKPSHIAYQVRDGKDDQSFFTRVGVAFAHRDGKGFNVLLDAIPVDGKITLRVFEEKPSSEDAS